MHVVILYFFLQEQYIFLHSAILEFVTCGDTQINAGDLRMVMRKYLKIDPVKKINKFQEQFNISVHNYYYALINTRILSIHVSHNIKVYLIPLMNSSCQ